MDLKRVAIRALSGSVYVAIIILACFCGQYGVAALSSLLGVLGVMEFRKMRFGEEPRELPLFIFDAMGALLLINAPYGPSLTLWLLWLIFRFIITVYSRSPHPERSFAVDIMGQVYIALPLALMNLFASLNNIGSIDSGHCMAIMTVFILIWINDTGAFIFGSLLGKHKLFERISPKKTWEGFIGGALTTIAAGFAFGAAAIPLSEFYVADKLWFWGLGGLLISIAATYGDLFESVIKRNLNLKDSGNLIPGHGGILDRIDSLLLVIPSMAVYILLFFL